MSQIPLKARSKQNIFLISREFIDRINTMMIVKYCTTPVKPICIKQNFCVDGLIVGEKHNKKTNKLSSDQKNRVHSGFNKYILAQFHKPSCDFFSFFLLRHQMHTVTFTQAADEPSETNRKCSGVKCCQARGRNEKIIRY